MKVNGLTLGVIGHCHFGNPIPHAWYSAARELLEYVNSQIGEQEYPKLIEPYIFQYGEELYVAFDPTDGGSGVVGAWRTPDEARNALEDLISAMEALVEPQPEVVPRGVLDAIAREGLTLVRTASGYSLMRLGQVTAQSEDRCSRTSKTPRKGLSSRLEAISPSMCPGWIIEDVKALENALRVALSEPQPRTPIAWRWMCGDEPDGDQCFPMPGPDADVVEYAAGRTFPRTVQYLYGE